MVQSTHPINRAHALKRNRERNQGAMEVLAYPRRRFGASELFVQVGQVQTRRLAAVVVVAVDHQHFHAQRAEKTGEEALQVRKMKSRLRKAVRGVRVSNESFQ